MWAHFLKAVAAFFAFIFFPFLVIAAAATVLVLFDHLTATHGRHSRHSSG